MVKDLPCKIRDAHSNLTQLFCRCIVCCRVHRDHFKLLFFFWSFSSITPRSHHHINIGSCLICALTVTSFSSCFLHNQRKQNPFFQQKKTFNTHLFLKSFSKSTSSLPNNMSLLLDSLVHTEQPTMTYLLGLKPVASSSVGIKNPSQSSISGISDLPSSLQASLPTTNATVASLSPTSTSDPATATPSASEVSSGGTTNEVSKKSLLVLLLFCVALAAPLLC